LGAAAASRLGVKPPDTVKLNGASVKVERITPTPPDGLDVGIFGPLGLVQDALKKPGEINAMRLAGCWCRVDVPVLASQVEGLLPDTKALTVAGMIKAQKGTVATAKKYSAVSFAVATFLIGAIVLVLIASQVKRQIREIGLLLATGSSPWFIVMLFVTKAGIVGILGGFAGYLLGFPLTDKVAARLIGLPLPVPDDLLGISIALAAGVSVIAALVPAAFAARLDPTVVLREVG
jgi:putative ABC transport system permease protein